MALYSARVWGEVQSLILTMIEEGRPIGRENEEKRMENWLETMAEGSNHRPNTKPHKLTIHALWNTFNTTFFFYLDFLFLSLISELTFFPDFLFSEGAESRFCW